MVVGEFTSVFDVVFAQGKDPGTGKLGLESEVEVVDGLNRCTQMGYIYLFFQWKNRMV